MRSTIIAVMVLLLAHPGVAHAKPWLGVQVPRVRPSTHDLILERDGWSVQYRFRQVLYGPTSGSKPTLLRDGFGCISIGRAEIVVDETAQRIWSEDGYRLQAIHRTDVLNMSSGESVAIESVIGGHKLSVWISYWAALPPEVYLACGYVPDDLSRGATLVNEDLKAKDFSIAQYQTAKGGTLSIGYDRHTGSVREFVFLGIEGQRIAYYFMGGVENSAPGAPATVIHTVHVGGIPRSILVLELLDAPAKSPTPSLIPAGSMVMDMRRPDAMIKGVRLDRDLLPREILSWPGGLAIDSPIPRTRQNLKVLINDGGGDHLIKNAPQEERKTSLVLVTIVILALSTCVIVMALRMSRKSRSQ